jgi:hypothetical protein
LFESGVINESTKAIATDTHQYLANAVGASASVNPTELNQITAALTAQKSELDSREAALREREIQVNLSNGSNAGNETATYVLSSILFVLLVLILLNYTLDYLRMKEARRPVGV